MIIIHDLKLSYGPHDVLKGINLTFEKGKVYGIVGENGAGKTSLFNCIAGIHSFSGTIRSDYAEIQNVIAYMPTEPYFMDLMTGIEYIQLLCNARKQALPNVEEKNIFDLPLQRYANQYSSGMKKKLSLTALLCLHNEIYILDEPFNGVDIQSNIMIKAIIQKLKDAGKLVIMSSHIFETLHSCCDVIHLIEHGKIERSAEPQDYMALEKYMVDKVVIQRLESMKI